MTALHLISTMAIGTLAVMKLEKNIQYILEKKKIPFILFVSTREVGAFNYMTWDQIREISKENFVEIGNHSHTHEYLVEEKSELIKSDIEKSISKINFYIKP